MFVLDFLLAGFLPTIYILKFYKTMRIFILSLAFLGLCLVGRAQDDNPYEGLETSKNLSLSQKQISKIKELNKGIGKQFAAIGKDRSLTGREKGEKKRELALKHKQDIMNVLNPEQLAVWESKYNKHNSGIKDNLTDALDDKLDALEKEYERAKKAIEKNESLSKYEKNARKDALKAKYTADKERLKEEKTNITNSVLLSE